MGCSSSQPETPPNPEFIDLTHFELLKVVGKGGFGKVNAIQRKQTGELMALKRMSKCEVIRKQSHVKMIWIERNIMSKLSSPFVVHLEHAFQSDKELFFVMPFMQGGDLRYHLTKRGIMNEYECAFYAAEMILALEHLHSQCIVYRDFKPDNLLLDSDGHLRLSDFGLAIQLQQSQNYCTKGNAGTAGYLAPEVFCGGRYGLSADVWSFGVTVYELLHGRRPFRRYQPITDTNQQIKFSSALSVHAKSFISGLLTANPRNRLGCGPGGWKEVKKHSFFREINFDDIEHKRIRPPIQPDLNQANCNTHADLADQLVDQKPAPIDPKYQAWFDGFEFQHVYSKWYEKKNKVLTSTDRVDSSASISSGNEAQPPYQSCESPLHTNSNRIRNFRNMSPLALPELASIPNMLPDTLTHLHKPVGASNNDTTAITNVTITASPPVVTTTISNRLSGRRVPTPPPTSFSPHDKKTKSDDKYKVHFIDSLTSDELLGHRRHPSASTGSASRSGSRRKLTPLVHDEHGVRPMVENTILSNMHSPTFSLHTESNLPTAEFTSIPGSTFSP